MVLPSNFSKTLQPPSHFPQRNPWASWRWPQGGLCTTLDLGPSNEKVTTSPPELMSSYKWGSECLAKKLLLDPFLSWSFFLPALSWLQCFLLQIIKLQGCLQPHPSGTCTTANFSFPSSRLRFSGKIRATVPRSKLERV